MERLLSAHIENGGKSFTFTVSTAEASLDDCTEVDQLLKSYERRESVASVAGTLGNGILLIEVQLY